VTNSQGRDFFISYTGVNRSWAEWIAVQLEQAGYTTVLQAWDFRPGSDFLHEMQQATSTAGRTIAVLSPAYFGSKFSEAEWRAAFANDPTGERGLLVPVRCSPVSPRGCWPAGSTSIWSTPTRRPPSGYSLLGYEGQVLDHSMAASKPMSRGS
jgi:hypothetical protein